MSKRKFNKKALMLGVITTSLLTGVVNVGATELTPNSKSVGKNSLTRDEYMLKNYAQPVILLHGFGGDGKTFRSTLGDYEHGNTSNESGLTGVKPKFYKKVDGVDIYNSGQDATVVVSDSKKAVYVDVPSKGESKEIVEVIFKKNKENLVTQQKYFKLAVSTLEKYYKTKGKSILRVNLVGEGMGGLTVSKYALDTKRSAHTVKDVPFVRSITTFQTPFLGVEMDWKNTCTSYNCTSAYRDLVNVSPYVSEWFYTNMINPTKRLSPNTLLTSVYVPDLYYGQGDTVGSYVKAGSAQGIKYLADKKATDLSVFASTGRSDVLDNSFAIAKLRAIIDNFSGGF